MDDQRPGKHCLPCAALRLVESVQAKILAKDELLVDFPLDAIGDVLTLIEPHFSLSERGRCPH